MSIIPMNVRVDVEENGFTVTDNNGFQRFLPVTGEEGSFLFKVDVVKQDSPLGFKSLVKHIDLSAYTDAALERYSNILGKTLKTMKSDSATWQQKLAALIFNVEFAKYFELRVK